MDNENIKSIMLNESRERTEMDVGKIHVVVNSRFSSTASETAVEKVKRLILQHIYDKKELDICAEKSVNGT